MTGRPRRSVEIPQQARERYVAKKAARRSRRHRLVPSECRGFLHLARFPKNTDPVKSATAERPAGLRVPRRSVARKTTRLQNSLDKLKEWIKATEKGFEAVAKSPRSKTRRTNDVKNRSEGFQIL